jgi:hypothetical protein
MAVVLTAGSPLNTLKMIAKKTSSSQEGTVSKYHGITLYLKR